MNNSDFILLETLKKINASAISLESAFLEEYYIARTGVYGKIPGFSRPLFVGGFSCKKDPSQAKSISCFEVAERILSTYYFSTPEMRDSYYPIQSVFTGNSLGSVKADEVLIGPTLYSPKNDTDAVGLGFHLKKKEAILHAVYELIERNILGKIWYENHPLIKVSETIIENYILSAFTIKSKMVLPFAMSIMHDKECNFLCMGAAFSNSTLEAKEKSKEEVIMLTHDVLANKSKKNVENKESVIRMLSQSDPLLSLRRKHYIDQISSAQINHEKMDVKLSLEQSLAALNIQEEDLSYCVLHESTHGYLIRAISNTLISLRAYRKKFINTEKYFLDPVC